MGYSELVVGVSKSGRACRSSTLSSCEAIPSRPSPVMVRVVHTHRKDMSRGSPSYRSFKLPSSLLLATAKRPTATHFLAVLGAATPHTSISIFVSYQPRDILRALRLSLFLPLSSSQQLTHKSPFSLNASTAIAKCLSHSSISSSSLPISLNFSIFSHVTTRIPSLSQTMLSRSSPLSCMGLDWFVHETRLHDERVLKPPG